MFTKPLFFLALLLALSTSVSADKDATLTDAVYHPGYASNKTILDLFLPASLKEANGNLKSGNLSASEKDFGLEISRHPDDLAAYVGLLQASRGKRDTLFPQYQTDEKSSPNLTNEFKLGVLAFYLFGEGLQSSSPSSAREQMLADVSRKGLQKAYEMSHSPLIGFVLADALDYTPGNSNNLVLFEDMLKHVGGPTAFQDYLTAKNSHWSTPLPSSAGCSKSDLLILSRIASNLRSQVSMTEGTVEETVVNGQKTITFGPGTYTQDQEKGMLYLHSWREQLLNVAASLSK